MGEISDMINEGILCIDCGGIVDIHIKEPPGYPQVCPDCVSVKCKKCINDPNTCGLLLDHFLSQNNFCKGFQGGHK